jgi:hypothetical protein
MEGSGQNNLRLKWMRSLANRRATGPGVQNPEIPGKATGEEDASPPVDRSPRGQLPRQNPESRELQVPPRRSLDVRGTSTRPDPKIVEMPAISTRDRTDCIQSEAEPGAGEVQRTLPEWMDCNRALYSIVSMAPIVPLLGSYKQANAGHWIRARLIPALELYAVRQCNSKARTPEVRSSYHQAIDRLMGENDATFWIDCDVNHVSAREIVEAARLGIEPRWRRPRDQRQVW